jgi:hypothetical protein
MKVSTGWRCFYGAAVRNHSEEVLPQKEVLHVLFCCNSQILLKTYRAALSHPHILILKSAALF